MKEGGKTLSHIRRKFYLRQQVDSLDSLDGGKLCLRQKFGEL